MNNTNKPTRSTNNDLYPPGLPPNPIHYLGPGEEVEKVDSSHKTTTFYNDDFVTTPPFFKGPDSVEIPQWLQRTINRFTHEELNCIGSRPDLARDKIYLFLAIFTTGCIKWIRGDTEGKYISIPSEELQRMFGKYRHNNERRNVYLYIIELLMKHKILYLYKNYSVGRHNNIYYLNKRHLSGIEVYTMQSEEGRLFCLAQYWKRYEKAIQSPIARHLLKSYEHITLPDKSTLEAIGKQLSNDKKRTNKGKLYTWKGKKSRNHWKVPKERAFIEDHIKAFELLTKRIDTKYGYMLPSPCGIRGGGRVVDSFTLCPSWIRKEITIKNEDIVDLDFSCLHPNIAIRVYSPIEESQHTNHDIVSEYLEIERQVAKYEHLSFFNKPHETLIYKNNYTPGMKDSPLYKYYMERFPIMMDKIIRDKQVEGYRITSQRLLTYETHLMTAIIKQLTELSIPCLYVYDAVYVQESKADQVEPIMNEAAADMGILTTVL